MVQAPSAPPRCVSRGDGSPASRRRTPRPSWPCWPLLACAACSTGSTASPTVGPTSEHCFGIDQLDRTLLAWYRSACVGVATLGIGATGIFDLGVLVEDAWQRRGRRNPADGVCARQRSGEGCDAPCTPMSLGDDRFILQALRRIGPLTVVDRVRKLFDRHRPQHPREPAIRHETPRQLPEVIDEGHTGRDARRLRGIAFGRHSRAAASSRPGPGAGDLSGSDPAGPHRPGRLAPVVPGRLRSCPATRVQASSWRILPGGSPPASGCCSSLAPVVSLRTAHSPR